jgi:hypothetical protein
MSIYKINLPLWQQLLLCAMFAFPLVASAQDNWKLEKSSSGVKIYTRFVSGWGIKEFKGVVRVKATLADVEGLLRDAKGRSDWMHNTYGTKDIKVISRNEMYSYSVVDAPWPVSDRDNVTRMLFKYDLPKEFTVELSAVPNEMAKQSGCVRIEKMQGYWKATDMGDGTVEVIQQAVADAGGSIPDWLANSSVIDSPYNTLLNLKTKLEVRNLTKGMFND